MQTMLATGGWEGNDFLYRILVERHPNPVIIRAGNNPVRWIQNEMIRQIRAAIGLHRSNLVKPALAIGGIALMGGIHYLWQIPENQVVNRPNESVRTQYSFCYSQ